MWSRNNSNAFHIYTRAHTHIWRSPFSENQPLHVKLLRNENLRKPCLLPCGSYDWTPPCVSLTCCSEHLCIMSRRHTLIYSSECWFAVSKPWKHSISLYYCALNVKCICSPTFPTREHSISEKREKLSHYLYSFCPWYKKYACENDTPKLLKPLQLYLYANIPCQIGIFFKDDKWYDETIEEALLCFLSSRDMWK